MNEIKIRAWSKYDNKMFYDVGITPVGVQVWDNEFFPPKLLLERGRALFELMLWTGHYDNENQPIYEGDVIQVMHNGKPYLGHKHKSVVSWDKFGWAPFYNNILFIPIEVKIIGNIWEHPHLLEGK